MALGLCRGDLPLIASTFSLTGFRVLLGIIPPRLFRVLRLPLTEVEDPTRDSPTDVMNLWAVPPGMPATEFGPAP